MVRAYVGPRLGQQILVNALGRQPLLMLGQDEVPPGGTAAGRATSARTGMSEVELRQI